ncbi:hypothetical protein VTI74DRAFT_1470 [Chaetomium olivicolor]
MANDTSRDTLGLPSPDTATSEGNSSVHVNFDAWSNRGRSIDSRSHSPSRRLSPSRVREPSLARQATTNSLSSLLSSQGSSHRSQSDRPAAEDVLRDLIAVTESGSNATTAALHGVKRPHDDEASDEPCPKRDKLGEELDRMVALPPATTSLPASTAPSAGSTLQPTIYPAIADGTSRSSDWIGPTAARGRLPIRAPRRPLPPLGNGTAVSHGSLLDLNEPDDNESDNGLAEEGT